MHQLPPLTAHTHVNIIHYLSARQIGTSLIVKSVRKRARASFCKKKTSALFKPRRVNSVRWEDTFLDHGCYTWTVLAHYNQWINEWIDESIIQSNKKASKQANKQQQQQQHANEK